MKIQPEQGKASEIQLEESIRGGLNNLAQPYLLRMGQLKNLYEGLE